MCDYGSPFSTMVPMRCKKLAWRGSGIWCILEKYYKLIVTEFMFSCCTTDGFTTG